MPDQDNTKTVDSASDQRVVNNVMRHEYRLLSIVEKERMKELKDAGLAYLGLLHAIGGTDPKGDRFATRELSISATKTEEAVMWAVKHLTR